MSATVLDMSMSLDGFIAGPNVRRDNGLGHGGERLHEWIFKGGTADPRSVAGSLTGVNKQLVGEFMATGAVIAGRGTFEAANGWDGDHHDGVPIYILSRHEAPDWAARWPLVHYMSALAEIVRLAKAAAGHKDVLVHGSGITQRALAAGLLDELEIHVVPVLFGAGIRLFDNLGTEHPDLERIRTLEGEDGVIHLRYRVRR
ncbi:MAG: dihydrofolate reductase family protein [Devosia sp.]